MSDSYDSNDSSDSADSIYSYSPSEYSKTDAKVYDMSRNRDKKLIKEIIRKGKGWSTPMFGEEVKVHYIGKLEDGTVFDSSRDRNQVFNFIVGRKQVVNGLDIGIKTMRCGEVSKFTIDSEYGFGTDGWPPLVPPNAKVIYEVELFYWKLIDITKRKDGGVMKRIINSGEGFEMPNTGSTCNVKLIGRIHNNVFDNRNVTFVTGEASENNVIDGIDIAVRKMRKHEKIEILVKPEYAFGSDGNNQFNIPVGYQEVVYEISLNNFENAKEWYELNDKQILEESEMIKTKGNHYFKESKYQLAINQYKRIVKLLKKESLDSLIKQEVDKEFESERNGFLLSSYQNISISFLKMDKFYESIKYCDLALKMDAINTKALLRRSLAYYGLKDYDLAQKDFKSILQYQPNNKMARNHLIICNNAIKAKKENDIKTFSSLFGERKQKEVIEEKDSDNIQVKEALDGLKIIESDGFKSQKESPNKKFSNSFIFS